MLVTHATFQRVWSLMVAVYSPIIRLVRIRRSCSSCPKPYHYPSMASGFGTLIAGQVMGRFPPKCRRPSPHFKIRSGNLRLRNISCCGDAESAATHIRQRIQTASDLPIRRVVIRRIVGGEGPGDFLEQVRGRYLAGDREIVEGGERREVVSVLDVR